MNIQSLNEIPIMVRLLGIYILCYIYGAARGDTSDAFLLGSLLISLLIAAVPNIIAKLPGKKKVAMLVDTTTVNASLVRRKLEAGGSFELIINNESIDMVGD